MQPRRNGPYGRVCSAAGPGRHARGPAGGLRGGLFCHVRGRVGGMRHRTGSLDPVRPDSRAPAVDRIGIRGLFPAHRGISRRRPVGRLRRRRGTPGTSAPLGAGLSARGVAQRARRARRPERCPRERARSRVSGRTVGQFCAVSRRHPDPRNPGAAVSSCAGDQRSYGASAQEDQARGIRAAFPGRGHLG